MFNSKRFLIKTMIIRIIIHSSIILTNKNYFNKLKNKYKGKFHNKVLEKGKRRYYTLNLVMDVIIK